MFYYLLSKMLSITRHKSDVTRGLRTHPVSDQAVFGRKSVAWWLGLRERWGGRRRRDVTTNISNCTGVISTQRVGMN